MGEGESGGGRGGGRMETWVDVRVHALVFSVHTELHEAHVASHRGRRAWASEQAGGSPPDSPSLLSAARGTRHSVLSVSLISSPTAITGIFTIWWNCRKVLNCASAIANERK